MAGITHINFNIPKTNESNCRKRKLTRTERRERVIEAYHPREKYRRYGAANISYSSIVFRNIFATLFAYLFFGIYCSSLVVSSIAFSIHGGDIAKFLVAVSIISFILAIIALRRSKRRKFVIKLRKLCAEKGIRLYENSSMMKNMHRPSGVCDLTVETRDCIYDIMFFPSPRRLARIRFAEPDTAQVATGIVRNYFKLTLGFNNEKVKYVNYSFEGSKVSSKKSVKVLLMNPAPYSMQAYDKRENKVVETGSGAEFFGYTAYSGNGFLGVLERQI